MKQQTLTIAQIKAREKQSQADRFVIPDALPTFRFDPHSAAIVIDIQVLPPSKNQYIRKHWATQQKKWFRPWATMMALAYQQAPEKMKVMGKVRVRIQLHFPDSRRRDPQNYTAFPPLMDVLVNLGIIQDDNSRVCRIEVPEPICDGTARTVIAIERFEK